MNEDSKTVQKTKRRLKEALLIILSDVDFQKKGVSDLCELAEVSRATFYLHYENKNDFILKMFDEITCKVAEQMVIWFMGGVENLEETAKRKNLVLDETDRELFYKAVKDNTNLEYVSHINYIIYSQCKQLFNKTDIHKNCDDLKKLDFFFRGYYYVVIDMMHNYSAKLSREKLKVIFDIYNALFAKNN